MALLVSALFAFGFMVAFATIVGTVVPAKDRILRLLLRGPEWTVDPLPSVRLTSRRGMIRQRAATAVAQPYRVAA